MVMGWIWYDMNGFEVDGWYLGNMVWFDLMDMMVLEKIGGWSSLEMFKSLWVIMVGFEDERCWWCFLFCYEVLRGNFFFLEFGVV